MVYTWVNGSDEQFLASIKEYTSTLDESRYNDKNELKYSLRSVVKYAPWIHHIYIVTNGQIPHWLDLNNPRISIVTHKEICPPELIDQILPTFSSFAIETFLHRIPKLTQRFLYFNDDVFLGEPLYLDHMATESEGTRIWNAWDLPDCSAFCQWAFIGDGACDINCYTEMCHFDGGDCDNSKGPEFRQDKTGEAYALVDDSAVKKIVVSVNGTVPDNYKFRDAPKIKVPKKKKSKSAKLLEHEALKNEDNTKQNASDLKRVQADIVVSDAKDKTIHAISKRIAYDVGRTHFVDSLVYSNYILNKKYGFKPRRVIAHVGFLLDKTIMADVIATFADEFNQTRFHRLRHGKDSLQLSFVYYNFLMSEVRAKSDSDIFDEIDRDGSGYAIAR